MDFFFKITEAARKKPKENNTPKPTLADGVVKYRLTDPASVNLVKEEVLPTNPIIPSVQVGGFYGSGHEINTPAGQAASVYMNVFNIIKNYNEFSEKPLEKWAAVDNLPIMPRAGRNLNAYYNRKAIAFFMEKDVAGNEIFTADSPDIVGHELGHAILDSLRPDLWNTANLEVWAFHETYGDILSMISSLQYPEVIRLVLDVTKGDLRKDNPVACMAEQLAQTLYSRSKKTGLNPSWLRNAINDFRYKSPITLPDDGPDDQLLAEPHSFSRILTGALYDCLVAIYEDEIANNRDPFVALLNAGKGLGWYISRAITRTPNKGKFFQSFANTMLAVDHEISERYYHDRFLEIFQKRGILANGQKLLLSKEQGRGRTVYVRLKDCLPLRAQSLNPLYDVQLQIADDGMDSILAAQDLVQYLHKCGRVSDSLTTPFRICDGKLERSHFSCYVRHNSSTIGVQNTFQSAMCNCGKKEFSVISPRTV